MLHVCGGELGLRRVVSSSSGSLSLMVALAAATWQDASEFPSRTKKAATFWRPAPEQIIFRGTAKKELYWGFVW